MSPSGPPPGASGSHEGRGRSGSLASGEPPVLLGRADELASLEVALAGLVQGRGEAFVVVGEAGIGKSTLLRAARARAAQLGVRCLATSGYAGEQGMAHAALLDLVTPVLEHLSALPAPQAEAVEAAVGRRPGRAEADPFLVGAGLLALLADTAAVTPLLLLVDDAHWLDADSAAALGFAVRRLRQDPVLTVVARRPDGAGAFDGLPLLELGGLRGAGPDLLVGCSRGVAQLVEERTGGNPLAMREAVRALTPEQRSGAVPLPDPLPVGERLERLYEPVVRALDPAAARALLVVALAVADPPGTALRALAGPDGADGADSVHELERAGLVSVDGALVVPHHPLVRTGAVAAATAGERRRVHALLAGTLADAPGDEARAARAWHLAEATSGPDDAVADTLTALAGALRARRGPAAAAVALERAARASADPGAAAERLAGAAAEAADAGDIASVRRLTGEVLAGGGGTAARLRARFALGLAEARAGSVPSAAEQLHAAADDADELVGGPAQLPASLHVRLLLELALVCFRLDDVAGMVRCAARIGGLADLDDPGQRVGACLVQGLAAAFEGDHDRAAPLLLAVVDTATSPPLSDDPRHVLPLAYAVGLLGDAAATDRAVAAAPRLIAAARVQGAAGQLVTALLVAGVGEARLGDHRSAFADVGEAVELGEQLGLVADMANGLEVLAWEAAARGLHADASRALGRARELVARAGLTRVAAQHALMTAYCALCRGDYEEVVEVLEGRLRADGGRGPLGEPLGVAPLLVEAYVALGRRAEAAALAERAAAAVPDSAPASMRAPVARAVGLAAEDLDDAVVLLERAAQLEDSVLDPVESARTRLLLGQRLRRAGRRVAARAQLHVALERFAAADLTLWQRRAEEELAATGRTARRGPAAGRGPLTSQETRVALLVAQGRTNREVATALFLSPKTVEHHLTTIFRKRGYRSRTELVRDWASGTARPDG